MNVVGVQERFALVAAVEQVGDVLRVEDDPCHASGPLKVIMAVQSTAMMD
jgi:hypothetical protein